MRKSLEVVHGVCTSNRGDVCQKLGHIVQSRGRFFVKVLVLCKDERGFLFKSSEMCKQVKGFCVCVIFGIIQEREGISVEI